MTGRLCGHISRSEFGRKIGCPSLPCLSASPFARKVCSTIPPGWKCRPRNCAVGDKGSTGRILRFSPIRSREIASAGQNASPPVRERLGTAAWIEQSIVPRFQAIGYFGGLFFYGYQWWLGRTLSGDQQVTWIAAVGLGGQRVFIIPDLDLVVMTTAGLYMSPRQGNASLDILYRFVIPSVVAKKGTR
jgi:hypothetical protein